MEVARDARWIVVSHLSQKYNKLPSVLEKEPLDNWYPEERLFIFYMDAYWGKQSSSIQMISIIKHEIEQQIKIPAIKFLPEAIRVNTEKMLENAPSAKERAKIQNMMDSNLSKQKFIKIYEYMDSIKELLTEEEYSTYKGYVDTEIAKNG